MAILCDAIFIFYYNHKQHICNTETTKQYFYSPGRQYKSSKLERHTKTEE